LAGQLQTFCFIEKLFSLSGRCPANCPAYFAGFGQVPPDTPAGHFKRLHRQPLGSLFRHL
jgi:hypothetical protein